MISCDVFELVASLEGRTLQWRVGTDLPGGTRIIVNISRHYFDTHGNECRWTLWDAAVLLELNGPGDRNGAQGAINVDEGDSAARMQFDRLLTPYSSGTKERIGSEIHVQATVGARQPMKAFGKNNGNLTGDKVVKSGDINIVQVSASVAVEMLPDHQPIW